MAKNNLCVTLFKSAAFSSRYSAWFVAGSPPAQSSGGQDVPQNQVNLFAENLLKGVAHIALLHDLHQRPCEWIVRSTGEEQLEGIASSLPCSHNGSIFIVLSGQWNFQLQIWATRQNHVGQPQIMHRSHLIFLQIPKVSSRLYMVPLICLVPLYNSCLAFPLRHPPVILNFAYFFWKIVCFAWDSAGLPKIIWNEMPGYLASRDLHSPIKAITDGCDDDGGFRKT